MIEDTIRALQDEFDRAELHADRETLQRLLADDFVSIGPKGFLLDKQAWIDRHDLFEYQELQTSELDIRVYDGTAIVRDVQRNKARYKDERVELAVRVSQVWVKQQDDWRLAAIQFSPLAEGGES